MLVFSALLPILAIIVLMTVFNQSAQKAGAVGATIALVIAIQLFDLGTGTHSGIGTTTVVTGILAEAIHTTLSIAWIIFPALCIFYWQQNTGGIVVIRHALSQIAPNQTFAVLIIAWFFGLFMEGAAGFGTPVAVAAPLLLSFGLPATKAVITVLFGHAMGVSFGAIGTPIIVQASTLDIDAVDIGIWAATLHILLGWILLLFMLKARDRTETIPLKAIVIAYLCFAVPFGLLAYFVGPELPTVAGSLIGLTLFVYWLKTTHSVKAHDDISQHIASELHQEGDSLLHALAPYIGLILLVGLTRTVVPIKTALDQYVWQWQYAETFAGNLKYFSHPGTLIVIAFVIGALFRKSAAKDIWLAVKPAFGQISKVCVALILMLVIARTMVHGQMINTLAEFAATSTGSAWPIFSPFIGVLGSFVTGSATASNILFSEFQANIAQTIGVSVPLILGVQAFGAAIGNIVCPHNIIAGCATVNLHGKEGEILRKTMLCCVIYSLAGGVLALLFSFLI